MQKETDQRLFRSIESAAFSSSLPPTHSLVIHAMMRQPLASTKRHLRIRNSPSNPLNINEAFFYVMQSHVLPHNRWILPLSDGGA